MIVTFAGDLHANSTALQWVYETAVANNADAIVQVGDFGFWPRHKQGQRFLAEASNLATTIIPLHFIDGNHEDHAELKGLGGEIMPGLHYHPRGTITTLGPTRFFWFGGAHSIDRHYRELGKSWFLNEHHTDDELAKATQLLDVVGPVDVTVTHDAPFGPLLQGIGNLNDFGTSPEDQLAAHRVRTEIDGLIARSGARLAVHGHWHSFAITLYKNRKIVSLGHDEGPVSKLTYTIELESIT
jgi:Icc-related predicted phosphoesterase